MVHTCTYSYDNADGKNERDISVFTSQAKTRNGVIRAAEKSSARDVEKYHKGRFVEVLTVDGNSV